MKLDTATAMYDYEKAKKWRTDHRYTRRQLSDLTGFSESSIEDFEIGLIRGKKTIPVSAAAMKRYRLCLAAVAHGIQDWDWGPVQGP